MAATASDTPTLNISKTLRPCQQPNAIISPITVKLYADNCFPKVSILFCKGDLKK